MADTQLQTGGAQGYLRIATEEAFATREQIDVYLRMIRNGTADKGMVSLWGFYGTSPSERAVQILDRLLDLGELIDQICSLLLGKFSKRTALQRHQLAITSIDTTLDPPMIQGR